MKTIQILEDAAAKGTSYKEVDVNFTFGAAYFYSKLAGNDLINFAEVIWDKDIDEIIKDCRKFGITEFTISSTFSSLITTIAEFEKRGVKLAGLTEINSTLDDWKLGMQGITQKERIPAFKMTLED